MRRTAAPRHFLLFAIFTSFVQYAVPLKLLDVRIPVSGVIQGSEDLQCLYDLSGDSLFSLKWYKDGDEFLRFRPLGTPPIDTFPVPGVTLAKHNSNGTEVTLGNLTTKSSGVYKCEVSADVSFQTLSKEENLTVIVPPQPLRPTFKNISSRYLMKEWVIGNCSSTRSSPPATLSLSANGVKLRSNELMRYPPERDSEGRVSVVVGIRLQVDYHHFTNGRNLILVCNASIVDRHWSSEFVVHHKNYPGFFSSSSAHSTFFASFGLFILLLSLLYRF